MTEIIGADGNIIGLSEGASDDRKFFAQNPTRMARIRKPMPRSEHAKDFQRLGPHREDLRRVIVLKHPRMLMPIPYLLEDSATFNDVDEELLPEIDKIFRESAAYYGMDEIKRK